MRLILIVLGTLVGNVFKSQRRLEVENLFLRHQLNIALRHMPRRLQLRGYDRGLMVGMTRLWPSWLGFPASCSPTPSCGGIGQGLGPIGAGNSAAGQGDPGLALNCANSSDG